MYTVEYGGLGAVEEIGALESVRQNDLLQIVNATEHECYLVASPTYHFVTPSQRHTSRFLRVGDAIRSLEILDQLAFWLLPVIAKADGILVDHWSISPVIMRALLLLGRRVPFECLPGHPRLDKLLATGTLERLLSVTPRGGRIQCVVSITGSGSLISVLKETLEEHCIAIDDNAITCLYGFLNSTDTSVMCRIPHAIENYASEDDCELCKCDSRPVPVDPRLYYVRSFKETEVALKKHHLDAGRDFIKSRGLASGALRVHRDDPKDGRHHAFDIDVLSLLDDKGFLQDFDRKLRAQERPDVVVAPDHEPGKQMAKIAAGAFGDVQVVIHGNLRSESGLSQTDAEILGAARRVLIVDDVLNSGTRLNEFNKALRERFGTFDSVVFLVGIARTESAAEWEENKIALTANHPWPSQLLYVDQVYLPRWGATVCPWCHEFDVLTRISARLTDPPRWLTDRIGVLSQLELGITNEPLFLLPGVSSRSLGSGSPVGSQGLSAIASLFVLACGLQHLRNDVDYTKRLDPRFPDMNVFAPKNLMNYSEGMLRAILLRLVRSHEWGDLNRIRLRRKLCEMATIANQDIMLGELLLCAARGTVPPIGRRLFESVYSKYLGEVSEAFAVALHL